MWPGEFRVPNLWKWIFLTWQRAWAQVQSLHCPPQPRLRSPTSATLKHFLVKFYCTKDAQGWGSLIIVGLESSSLFTLFLAYCNPPPPPQETRGASCFSFMHSLQDLGDRRGQELESVCSTPPHLCQEMLWSGSPSAGLSHAICPLTRIRLVSRHILWPKTQKSLTYPSMVIMAIKQGPRALRALWLRLTFVF